MVMESFDLSYTIIIALIVLVVAVLFIILACLYCFRSNKSAPYKRAPILKTDDATNKSTIINLDKKKQSNDDENLLNDEEKFKYLGINLSDIPFIDDSRCSSYIDLSGTWTNANPYKPLTNTIS